MRFETCPILIENGITKTLGYSQGFQPISEHAFNHEAALMDLSLRVKLPDGKYYVAIPVVAP